MYNSLSNLVFILRMQNKLCSLEKCWMGGYYHGQKGNEENLNPYQEDSKESQFWLEGWWSGFYDEPALFPKHAVSLEKTIKPTNVVQLFKSGHERALVGLGAIVGGSALVSIAMDLVA